MKYGTYDKKMVDAASAKLTPEQVRDLVNYDYYEMNRADAEILISHKHDLPFEYVIGCVDYQITSY
jgi:hypothetical protein